MTNTTAATLVLYFQREATTRQLGAIDATLANPATSWSAGEIALEAKARVFDEWTSHTRQFDVAYLDLCQEGLAREFWNEVARRGPEGTAS